MASELLTIVEAGRFLRIGRDKAYELVRAGAIPSIRLGPKTIRVPRSALMGWLAELAEETVQR